MIGCTTFPVLQRLVHSFQMFEMGRILAQAPRKHTANIVEVVVMAMAREEAENLLQLLGDAVGGILRPKYALLLVQITVTYKRPCLPVIHAVLHGFVERLLQLGRNFIMPRERTSFSKISSCFRIFHQLGTTANGRHTIAGFVGRSFEPLDVESKTKSQVPSVNSRISV